MKQFLPVIMSFFVLTGCLSVLPEPAPLQGLYRVPQLEQQPNAGPIVIREPEALRIFAGAAMVSASEDESLRYLPGVEWTGSATRLFQLTLLNALSNGLAPESSVRGQYELDWRINDLTIYPDRAQCELAVTMLNGITRSVIDQKRFTASVPLSSEGNRASGLTRAAQSCLQSAAEWISERAVE